MAITITPFQKNWAQKYQKEERFLKEELPHVTFYHIGSTAIPGCDAKPIIDILGVTTDILKLGPIEGYECLGEFGMKQRCFYRKKGTVHLYVFEDTDPEVNRHLRFTEYLKAHSEKVREYSNLKRKLVGITSDINTYCLGKEAFIKNVDHFAALHAQSTECSFGPKRQTWSHKQIIHAMENNMHLHMTYFAKYIPTQSILFQPDVTVVQSDISDDTYNYVLAARFENEDRAESIVELYRKRKLPFSWWVGENDTPENLSKILQNLGLQKKRRRARYGFEALCH